MANSLEHLSKNVIPEFNQHLEKWSWCEIDSPKTSHKMLDAIKYSLFSGGKRFRPLLCFALAEASSMKVQEVFGWAMAIEAVHTYSLIHDDLPCLDNDDFRRGTLTNHKKFSESTALLSGDSLLTSSFEIISSYYENQPEIGLKLCYHLSRLAGANGMVGGQFLDVNIDHKAMDLGDLRKIHQLKTGALIAACGVGVAHISNHPNGTLISELSWGIGQAFQLADDLLDYDPNKLEGSNLVEFFGKEKAKHELKDLTERLLAMAFQLQHSNNNTALTELIELNSNRKL